jgi:hypothetical protein
MFISVLRVAGYSKSPAIIARTGYNALNRAKRSFFDPAIAVFLRGLMAMNAAGLNRPDGRCR